MLPILCSLGRKNCALKVRNVKKTGIPEKLPCEQRLHFRGISCRAKSSYFSHASSYHENVAYARRVGKADPIESFIPFGRLPMDCGDHFKVVVLKKSGQYNETFRSVFCHFILHLRAILFITSTNITWTSTCVILSNTVNMLNKPS